MNSNFNPSAEYRKTSRAANWNMKNTTKPHNPFFMNECTPFTRRQNKGFIEITNNKNKMKENIVDDEWIDMGLLFKEIRFLRQKNFWCPNLCSEDSDNSSHIEITGEKKMLIVFDTSGLLRDTTLLPLCFEKSCHMLIPYTVIKELDGLSKSGYEKLRKKVIRTYGFLHEYSKKECNYLHIESIYEASYCVKEFGCQNNDDVILKCALINTKQYRDEGILVIFVTNDRGLAVKATAHNIYTVDTKELIEFLITKTSEGKRQMFLQYNSAETPAQQKFLQYKSIETSAQQKFLQYKSAETLAQKKFLQYKSAQTLAQKKFLQYKSAEISAQQKFLEYQLGESPTEQYRSTRTFTQQKFLHYRSTEISTRQKFFQYKSAQTLVYQKLSQYKSAQILAQEKFSQYKSTEISAKQKFLEYRLAKTPNQQKFSQYKSARISGQQNGFLHSTSINYGIKGNSVVPNNFENYSSRSLTPIASMCPSESQIFTRNNQFPFQNTFRTPLWGQPPSSISTDAHFLQTVFQMFAEMECSDKNGSAKEHN
ncbi:PIN domain family protein [Acanthocheilonema viteae]